MNINEERADKGKKPMASPKDVAKKWARATTAAAPKYAEAMAAQNAERLQHNMLSTLERIDYHLAEINTGVHGLADKLDHIHRDVADVRETLSIQRPECYGPPPRQRRAKRPPKPSAPETGEQGGAHSGDEPTG